MMLAPPPPLAAHNLELLRHALQRHCRRQGYKVTTRTSTTWETKAGVQRRRAYFSCHRSASSRSAPKTSRVPRTDCPFVAVAEQRDGLWSLTVKVPYHNHAPITSQQRQDTSDESQWQKSQHYSATRLKSQKSSGNVPASSQVVFDLSEAADGFRMPASRNGAQEMGTSVQEGSEVPTASHTIVAAAEALSSLRRAELRPNREERHGESRTKDKTTALPGEDLKVEDLIPCPLCEVLVSRSLHDAYTTGDRIGFEDQPVFCREHRRRTAAAQWRQQSYPEIDWSTWPSTCLPRHAKRRLLDIMAQRCDSHFTEILRGYASQGLSAFRKFLCEDIVDTISTGYYGPRGAQVMAKAIQQELGKHISRYQEKNTLVQRAGVGGYTQAVLIPELAVMHIQSDMGLATAEEARVVLRQSADCGNVLQPEEDDEIGYDEEEQGFDDG